MAKLAALQVTYGRHGAQHSFVFDIMRVIS